LLLLGLPPLLPVVPGLAVHASSSLAGERDHAQSSAFVHPTHSDTLANALLQQQGAEVWYVHSIVGVRGKGKTRKYEIK
jgi:hypothetical protein